MSNLSAVIMNQTPGVCLDGMHFADSPKIKNLYITFELIIAVLAIIGNFLVCLSITRTKKLRTIHNYFLVSLAVADMLVGLVAIPCAVLINLGQIHHDLPLCLLIISVLMVLTQSSILSLLAVAADRYMAILLPFQYQRLMRPREACIALLLTWSLAVLSGCVPVIDWQKRPGNSMNCIFTCVVRMSFMVYWNFFCFLLIPLIAMFIIYARIFIIVQGQLRRIAQARTHTRCTGPEDTGNMEATAGQNDTHVHKSGTRASTDSIFTITNPPDPNRAKTLCTHQKMQKAMSIFLLLFLFTVCWMPIQLLNCVYLFCPTCDVPISIMMVAILLSHANSALNPLLYAYRMRSFRRALMQMWRAVWTSKHN